MTRRYNGDVVAGSRFQLPTSFSPNALMISDACSLLQFTKYDETLATVTEL